MLLINVWHFLKIFIFCYLYNVYLFLTKRNEKLAIIIIIITHRAAFIIYIDYFLDLLFAKSHTHNFPTAKLIKKLYLQKK